METQCSIRRRGAVLPARAPAGQGQVQGARRSVSAGGGACQSGASRPGRVLGPREQRDGSPGTRWTRRELGAVSVLRECRGRRP